MTATILLVDDEPQILQALSGLLQDEEFISPGAFLAEDEIRQVLGRLELKKNLILQGNCRVPGFQPLNR